MQTDHVCVKKADQIEPQPPLRQQRPRAHDSVSGGVTCCGKFLWCRGE